jgi:lathosterol oxidase
MSSLSIEHYEKIESYIPVDLLSISGFVAAFAVVLFFVVFRYFLLTGGAYFYFWKFNREGGQPLHDKNIPQNQIRSEIKHSMISSFIFAFSGVVIGVLWQSGYSQVYLKFSEYGWWYLPVSFLLYSLVHEVYFYFTHIWMHQPKYYRKVHLVHHLSVKTSPWASFSFHSWEATVHAVFLPLMVLWLPVHPTILIAYLTFMTLTAISNHLGVEVIPVQLVKDQFISGEHHGLHHKKANCNFGLYYTFIDKLLGTDSESVVKKRVQPQASTRTVYE